MPFSIGLTFTFIGEFMLAVAIYLVHGKLLQEKRLDKKVFMELYKEEIITIIAILFLLSGYIMQIFDI
ncbi:MAG: hypothetical protein QXS91_02810 [Candidatus Anstonellales archaeon]